MSKPIRPAPSNVPGPMLIKTPEWFDRAACIVPTPGADATPEEQEAYLESLDAPFPRTKDEARSFIRDNCRRCWTQSECYEFAIKNDVKHGVWGGQLIGRDDGDGLGT